MYVDVLLDQALDRSLEYRVPEHLWEKVGAGTRVTVPIRSKQCHGTVLKTKSICQFKNAKDILAVMDDGEAIPADLQQLAEWIARYYCTPLRSVLQSLLPSSVRQELGHKEQLFVTRAKTKEELTEVIIKIREKAPSQAAILESLIKAVKGKLLSELLEETGASRSAVDSLAKKGLVELQKMRIDRSPLEGEEYFIAKPKKLNMHQQAALEKIGRSMADSQFKVHLLFGVTGSGKTEVYLQAIEKALAMGKTALMMVPEIALTTQMIERFRCRFQDKMAVLHYRLSEGERFDAWHGIRNGDIKIVIGARSSIFCPLQNIGIIIVDEEHEASYKQIDKMPCYHARDVAVMRGKFCNTTVVLGSATPSIESYQNALNGKYELSCLSERADSAKLPSIKIVDMKKEMEKAQGFTTFSGPLLDGIAKRIEKGEQTILFLNRRGYHSMLMCKECGITVKCKHCDTSLTFHLNDNHLACHLCGFQITPPPRQCPSCKSNATMKFKGVGTELVERSLHAIFPEVRTLRIDADTTKHKGSHQKLLRDFGTGKADVLVGTQMIAKGLHFPEVTLVGVLNCDSSINIPDFRASEHTFQLLSQVAGRAGRGVAAGEVIIQTCLPENSIIQHAATHDFESFFKEELQSREAFEYPPFSQLIKVAVTGEEQFFVRDCTELLRAAMASLLPPQFMLLPVVPAGHAKVKDRFRFQFIAKGPGVSPLVKAYQAALTKTQNKKNHYAIDVNPLSTFF